MSVSVNERLDRISQKIVVLNKLVSDYGRHKYTPKSQPKKQNSHKKSKFHKIPDQIPQEVLDRSYAIFRSSKKVEEAINKRLTDKYFKVWQELYFVNLMKRKPSEKEIIEEKNHPEEEFSSEDNDGYEFSEENQAEEEELNEPHESSDHTESEDSEIKQILEMRIPVIGKKTYEEEESY